jgi:hypothetical protein
MHMRIAKLTIGGGAAGDVNDLLDRIDGDLVGPYSIAEGFVGYFNVADPNDASIAYTVRVFADEPTLEAASAALSNSQGAIVTDFDLTVDAVVANDVSAGAAYALTTA